MPFHSIRNERQVEWRSAGDLRNYYVNEIVSVKWQIISSILRFSLISEIKVLESNKAIWNCSLFSGMLESLHRFGVEMVRCFLSL